MKDDMERYLCAARFAADLDDEDGPKNAALLMAVWGRGRVAERVALLIEAKTRFDAISRACQRSALLLSDALED